MDAAKITITNAFNIDSLGFLGGVNTQTFGTGDKLTATSASFNAAAGTYTFIITGSGTAAEYQQVLEEVDYGATSGVDPTFGGAHTQRNVTWALSLDGTNFGTAATSTIDELHSAIVGVGNTGNFIEGEVPILIEPRIGFTDTDTITDVQINLAGNESISTDQLGFLNSAGTGLQSTFTFTKNATFTIGGITFTGDGSSFQIAQSSNVWTINQPTGAVAATNLDFEIISRDVAYQNNSDPTSVFNPNRFGVDARRDFIWSINDNNTAQNFFASGTRNSDGTITDNPTIDPNPKGGSLISVFHKAPVIGAGGAVPFTGAASPSPVVLDSGFTLTDSDAIKSATVSISGGFLAGDTLTFGAVAGATVGASSTSGGVVSETLTFNRRASALFDTNRFRAHLEQAFLTMLDIAGHGEAPRSFSVETGSSTAAPAVEASLVHASR